MSKELGDGPQSRIGELDKNNTFCRGCVQVLKSESLGSDSQGHCSKSSSLHPEEMVHSSGNNLLRVQLKCEQPRSTPSGPQGCRNKSIPTDVLEQADRKLSNLCFFDCFVSHSKTDFLNRPLRRGPCCCSASWSPAVDLVRSFKFEC